MVGRWSARVSSIRVWVWEEHACKPACVEEKAAVGRPENGADFRPPKWGTRNKKWKAKVGGSTQGWSKSSNSSEWAQYNTRSLVDVGMLELGNQGTWQSSIAGRDGVSQSNLLLSPYQRTRRREHGFTSEETCWHGVCLEFMFLRLTLSWKKQLSFTKSTTSPRSP